MPYKIFELGLLYFRIFAAVRTAPPPMPCSHQAACTPAPSAKQIGFGEWQTGPRGHESFERVEVAFEVSTGSQVLGDLFLVEVSYIARRCGPQRMPGKLAMKLARKPASVSCMCTPLRSDFAPFVSCSSACTQHGSHIVSSCLNKPSGSGQPAGYPRVFKFQHSTSQARESSKF
jgi:hypothetical protein